MKMKDMPKVWKKVFSNKRYIVLTVLVAFLFYSFNVVINNWDAIPSFYNTLGLFGTIKLFFTLLWGFGGTVKLHSYVSLLIISVLFGLLFGLMAYKTSMIKTENSKVGLFASAGIFIGALAPGCAACGVGILSLVGLSAAFLNFLPFEGLELSILSVALLSFSVFKISENIHRGNVCKINFNKMKVSEKALNQSHSLTFTRLKGGNK